MKISALKKSIPRYMKISKRMTEEIRNDSSINSVED